MPDANEQPPTPLRTELLLPLAVLFLAAVVVAIGAAAVVLPLAPSPGAALLPLSLIVLADLAILYLFLRSLLRRTVIAPVDDIVAHAERITEGDLDHRIPPAPTAELDRIVASVNTLAHRLIAEKSALALNVTSLEETNRALSEASQELVRSARLASVGTLSAGVAHEIGNPLAAIRAYLDVMESRMAQGRPVDELVADLRTETGRIDEIVQGILAFGRPDPREPTPFSDWEGLLERVEEDLVRGGGLRGASLGREVSPGLPAVRAHPPHLERVLVNLVRNAAQAVEEAAERAGDEAEPGQVLVRVRSEPGRPRSLAPRREEDPLDVNYAHRRRLSELLTLRGTPPPEPAERDLVLEVHDNGPGIPDAILDALFDPFFTTRPPGKGVGMGLALAARIVAELGGEIDARNRPEGGALFRVRLPGASGEA